MVPLSLSLAVMCVLSVWTIAAGCGDRQYLVDRICCDLCPPGTHRQSVCSKQQSVCIPCEDGYYSDQYQLFDRCEECRSCQQDYAEKCTPTTNANCSCRSGFLCSNNICSKCEENKCVTGEKLKRTDNNPTEVLAVSTNASDFHLSKEESGLELIVQDELKNSNSLGFLHL
ncbi:tumor necrosis factor receptor superfamily member 6-like [Lycodopsis pacificus]